MKGWISIHRSIKNNWLYPKGRPMTKYEAWITILLEVNHTDMKESKGFTLIECKRGESLKSLDTWAKLFFWNKSKVRRFFIMLQKDLMIETKSVQKTTHLRVCNYDSYQNERNETETKLKRKRNGNETELTPNNNVNNVNNENNLINIPFNAFWNLYNKKVGSKEKLIGKWDKLTDEERVNIINYLPGYILSTSEKKFRKNPETFLNNKSWNDEIIKEETPGRKKTSIDFDQKQTTDSEYDNDPFLPPLNKTE